MENNALVLVLIFAIGMGVGAFFRRWEDRQQPKNERIGRAERPPIAEKDK